MKPTLCAILCFSLTACSATQTSTTKQSKTCEKQSANTDIACIKATIKKHPLGSKKNPVRADGVKGQQNYISRLICSNGDYPNSFNHSGSVGLGPYGFVLDHYFVSCKTKLATEQISLYMDKNHRHHHESQAAYGFNNAVQ